MPVLCIDPRLHPLWQELLSRRESSVFHAPAWPVSNLTVFTVLDEIGEGAGRIAAINPARLGPGATFTADLP